METQPTPSEGAAESPECRVTVTLGEFARDALTAEAERQGVSVEELLAYAAMHYLADLDRRRSRRAAGPLRSTA